MRNMFKEIRPVALLFTYYVWFLVLSAITFGILDLFRPSGDTSIVSLSGPFGDTIGGLLGPLSGLIASFFAYNAFRQQNDVIAHTVEANRLAQENNQLTLAQSNYGVLNETVSDILSYQRQAENSLLGVVTETYVAYSDPFLARDAEGFTPDWELPSAGSIIGLHSKYFSLYARLEDSLNAIARTVEQIPSLILTDVQRTNLEWKINQFVNSDSISLLRDSLTNGRVSERDIRLAVPQDSMNAIGVLVPNGFPDQVANYEIRILNLLNTIFNRNQR